MIDQERIVFVVDDDPGARESVVALVASKGLDVVEYSSAEEFLASYDSTRKGCLVADVRMKEMSGLDLLRRLNQDKIVLPTIVITGYADVPMAVQAMQDGAVTFLEKPCKKQELWSSIELALDLEKQQRLAAELQSEVEQRIEQLTLEERAVMGMVVQGIANKRIATELDIGLRTVELRRSQVMKVLRAESLPELVRMAILVNFQPPKNLQPPEE
ncbi:MAG: response regulator [Pirellulaceae bacterium]|jgi:FixJ family two-component response regulator|nr:response regulator [Pirellulaceae bacterium]